MRETLLGMSLLEYRDIIKFIEKHHSYTLILDNDDIEYRKRLFPKLNPTEGFKIKYVDNCYDSRTMYIWSITFRKTTTIGYKFNTNHYDKFNPPPTNWKYQTLYELCMAYLTGEFEPTDDFMLKIN